MLRLACLLEYDQRQPDVIVGSFRGGAVAMNIGSGDTPHVLLCPAWKKWGTATTIKPNSVILHSRIDDVIPFADSEELINKSGLTTSSLIEVGNDHRLAYPEPLAKMLEVCERVQGITYRGQTTGAMTMNHVAAMKWNLAQLNEHGAGVTLSQLDERLASESFSDADCREWLDGMLAQEGPQFRALDALVLKLSTIGSAIAERLNKTAVEQLSVEEISRLLAAYLDFKQVIEEVVPKKK